MRPFRCAATPASVNPERSVDRTGHDPMLSGTFLPWSLACGGHPAAGLESHMALTKSEVLARLERVASPDGLALPETGALSRIVVSDGKVFFSITIDAAAVNAWGPGRKRAEAAVQAAAGPA